MKWLYIGFVFLICVLEYPYHSLSQPKFIFTEGYGITNFVIKTIGFLIRIYVQVQLLLMAVRMLNIFR
jgi:hypothetical protein